MYVVVLESMLCQMRPVFCARRPPGEFEQAERTAAPQPPRCELCAKDLRAPPALLSETHTYTPVLYFAPVACAE